MAAMMAARATKGRNRSSGPPAIRRQATLSAVQVALASSAVGNGSDNAISALQPASSMRSDTSFESLNRARTPRLERAPTLNRVQSQHAQFEQALMKPPVKKPPPPKITKKNRSATQLESDNGCGIPLLDPREQFMKFWDFLIAILLIYTCTVTPFEVALVQDLSYTHPLFVTNRFVDFCFICDCFINLNVIYYDDEEQRWVLDRLHIFLHYLRGTLLIDFASSIPIEVLVTATQPGDHSSLGSLRALRVLRLTKLLRILRSNKIMRRIEEHYHIHYSYVTLAKFGLSTVLLAHWLACSFCLVREATDRPCNWVDAYLHFQSPDEASSPCGPHRVTMLTKYLSALYWSAMTISTVGYGDIVPTNNEERAFVICGLFVGASFFSYVVGSVCSVLAKLSEKEEEFQMLMCDLNGFIEEAKIEKELAQRLRAYFRYQNSQTTTIDVSNWLDLIQRMSPTLQNAVALQLAGTWIEQVQAFDGVDEALLVSLSFGFHACTYPPEEVLWTCDEVVTDLSSKRRGVVLLFKRATTSWRQVSLAKGHELLGSEAFCGMRHIYCAITMSYVEVQVIPLQKLQDIMVEFPDAVFRLRQLVRAQALRYTVRSVIEAVQRVRRCLAAGEERRAPAAMTELVGAARGLRPPKPPRNPPGSGGRGAALALQAGESLGPNARRLSELAGSVMAAKSMRRTSQGAVVGAGSGPATGLHPHAHPGSPAAAASSDLSGAHLPRLSTRAGLVRKTDTGGNGGASSAERPTEKNPRVSGAGAESEDGADLPQATPVMTEELAVWIVEQAMPAAEWSRRKYAAMVLQRFARGYLARLEKARIALEAQANEETLLAAYHRRLLLRAGAAGSMRSSKNSFANLSDAAEAFGGDSPVAARAVQQQLSRLEKLVEMLAGQIGGLVAATPGAGGGGLGLGLGGSAGPGPGSSSLAAAAMLLGPAQSPWAALGSPTSGASAPAGLDPAGASLARRGQRTAAGMSPLGPGGSSSNGAMDAAAIGGTVTPKGGASLAQAWGGGGDSGGSGGSAGNSPPLAQLTPGAAAAGPFGTPPLRNGGLAVVEGIVASIAAPTELASAVALAASAAESAAVAAQAASDAAATARAAAVALGAAVRAAEAARASRKEALLRDALAAPATAAGTAGTGTPVNVRAVRRFFSMGASLSDLETVSEDVSAASGPRRAPSRQNTAPLSAEQVEAAVAEHAAAAAAASAAGASGSRGEAGRRRSVPNAAAAAPAALEGGGPSPPEQPGRRSLQRTKSGGDGEADSAAVGLAF